MRSYPLLALAGLALCPLTTSVVSGALIFENRFGEPSELTYTYPAPAGTPVRFHGNFSAWTREGLISATYGSGLGTEGSGGVLCTIVKVSPLFMQASQSRILLPITDPAYTTLDQIKSYVVAFDAKIPAGKLIEVRLSPDFNDPTMKTRAEASRLILGTVEGTGEYTHYVMPVAKLGDTDARIFLQFLRDANLNGMEKLTVSIYWTLLLKRVSWSEGESFQMDNITLSDGK